MNNALSSAAAAAGYCATATCTPAELLKFAQEHGDELTGDLAHYASALVSESAKIGTGAAGARAAAKLGLDPVCIINKSTISIAC